MIILQNQGADDGAQEGSTVHPAYGDSVMNDLTVPPGREETSDGSGPFRPGLATLAEEDEG